MTAVGAGFLIRDRYLFPLLAVFLLVSVGGTGLSMKRHGRKTPLLLSTLGGVATFGGIFLSPVVAYVGIAVLLLASVLDYRAGRATSARRR